MAISKILGAQRDFSAGELDESLKRADENLVMKTGARQMANWRVLNGGQVSNRPGRRALAQESGRVEEILMSPSNTFYLVFGVGYLRVYNAAFAQVFNSTVKGDGSTAIPWTATSIYNVSYDIVSASQFEIFILYADGAPANVPQVLSWDGVSQTSTWTLTTFAETNTTGQKRTIFDRLSPQNVEMAVTTNDPTPVLADFLPGATVNLTFTLNGSPYNILTAGMVAAHVRFAFCGRQLLLETMTDGAHGTALVEEPMPSTNVIDQAGTSVPPANVAFQVGDVVNGSLSGAKGIVVATSATTVTVQLIPTSSGNIVNFVGTTTYAAEYIVGPNGSIYASGSAGAVTVGPPAAVAVWDDEVMNAYRGYPSSVTFDQNRIIFCNFPARPDGIAWSALGLFFDMYVVAQGGTLTADNAIFEYVPDKAQVLYVIGGMESSEFIFCDTVIYYIPISTASPLAPGSVAFNRLSKHGSASNVRPQLVEQSILYLRRGGAQMGAVQAPGAYYRPYVVDSVSEYHSHLFTASPVIAIAVPQAPQQTEEKYAYLLRADGVVLCGKYAIRQGLIDVGQDGKPKVGWLPWPGLGFVTWISAQGADVIFTTTYYINSTLGSGWSSGWSVGFGNRAGSPVSIVEVLDNSQYLDCVIPLIGAPTALAPPSGKGPLYLFAGGSVMLLDNGARPMGQYQVDANGFIVPQFTGGENLTDGFVLAGQPWLSVLEPFAPDASPGQSVHQRMFKRRISRMAVYISNSTGFVMARLFADNVTPNSPPYGTVMNIYRVNAYNQDDDATQPPPWREEAQRWRPLGRAYDPRVAVIKDTPGPLIVHEIGLEATI